MHENRDRTQSHACKRNEKQRNHFSKKCSKSRFKLCGNQMKTFNNALLPLEFLQAIKNHREWLRVEIGNKHWLLFKRNELAVSMLQSILCDVTLSRQYYNVLHTHRSIERKTKATTWFLLHVKISGLNHSWSDILGVHASRLSHSSPKQENKRKENRCVPRNRTEQVKAMKRACLNWIV